MSFSLSLIGLWNSIVDFLPLIKALSAETFGSYLSNSNKSSNIGLTPVSLYQKNGWFCCSFFCSVGLQFTVQLCIPYNFDPILPEAIDI